MIVNRHISGSSFRKLSGAIFAHFERRESFRLSFFVDQFQNISRKLCFIVNTNADPGILFIQSWYNLAGVWCIDAVLPCFYSA